MEKAALTISLSPTMQFFIGRKLQEDRFSAPSEYIRPLLNNDQDLNDDGYIVAIVRRLRDDSVPRGRMARRDPNQPEDGWRASSRPNRRRRISAGRET
jgi:Arc/MetJ-type ribon-helix-helix transcriptional regulator